MAKPQTDSLDYHDITGNQSKGHRPQDLGNRMSIRISELHCLPYEIHFHPKQPPYPTPSMFIDNPNPVQTNL